jgi:aldehyde dehydrogenase (NAD+)
MKEQLSKMRAYFESGVTYDYEFRAEKLNLLKKAVKKYEQDIIAALKADMDRSEAEAFLFEIYSIYTEINYILKRLKSWMRPKRVKGHIFTFPSKYVEYKDPLGVVLIMSPWNYPFQLSIDPLVACIAAGNCAVIKPSRYSPSVSSVIKNMIEEFFEPEYITVFEGGSAVNTALLEHKFDYIFFTGSGKVGRIVMEAAAKHLTPVTLELGGKNPCIVDKTANLEVAARRIAWGKWVNCGQTCIAPDYILVEEEVKDAFVQKVIENIRLMYGQEPLDSPDYGRIINEKHFDRLTELLKDVNIAYGGRTDKKRLKIEPTVLSATPADAPMQEEIFGPILPVIAYKDIEQAYEIISRFPQSLAFYLFSKDKTLAKEIIRKFSFGGGCINDVLLHAGNFNSHFGGVGESGMGAYHGKSGFDALSHTKMVMTKSYALDFSLRYPPYKDRAGLMRKYLGK